MASLANASVDEAAGELLRLLDAAVARRLVADVPVGVFLSRRRGLDGHHRARGAATSGRCRRSPSAFDEASFDESAFAQPRRGSARDAAPQRAALGAGVLDLLPDAVASLDEPFADPSFLPTLLLSRFVRKHVTVALAGDGGDELFAGYDPFLAHRPAALMARLPACGARRDGARGAASCRRARRNMSLDFRLKQLFRGLSAEPALRHQAWIGALRPERAARGARARARGAGSTTDVVYREPLAEAARAEALGVEAGSVDEALRFYLGRYLADDILVKADRASMAASLEVRAPFLDTHVVEFAARLPWQTKLTLTRTKVVLKRALAELVPAEILARPKKGFGIPVAQWIRGPLRPLYEDLFSEGSLAQSRRVRARTHARAARAAPARRGGSAQAALDDGHVPAVAAQVGNVLTEALINSTLASA